MDSVTASPGRWAEICERPAVSRCVAAERSHVYAITSHHSAESLAPPALSLFSFLRRARCDKREAEAVDERARRPSVVSICVQNMWPDRSRVVHSM